ncbi:unnamed protein product [Rotaria sp. Silwood2]|nr:unnamed protein product [Rotaria sp. Silwood2]CAF4196221.1 unnamed protein product [Rotaria sp. Silwood2]
MEDFDVFRHRVQKVNTSRQDEDDLQMSFVGLTYISSNKSESELVSSLSDSYGRCDDLRVQISCDKKST